MGIWFLVPEHLRLGTWDLLLHWTQVPAQELEPRLAMHLIHEAALCLNSTRTDRCLSQNGFELVCGLPFVPTDSAIHHMLDAQTVGQTQQLQIALGKLRRASGHFKGQLLAFDPHRLVTYSQRQMRRRTFPSLKKPAKNMQTFFVVDADTRQPLCFTLHSAAHTVTQSASDLLQIITEILNPDPVLPKPLLLADKEHYTHQFFEAVAQSGLFDLLAAVPGKPTEPQIASAAFQEHWPGYATAKQPFAFAKHPDRSYWRFMQRDGIDPHISYNSFLCTNDRAEVPALTRDFPQRWSVEEFFNFDQALGWNKARTFNLNIRYGRMTMGLLAQTVIHQLRRRLGEPYAHWSADHFARQLFEKLEGDVRVEKDTIIVTCYNAPNAELLRRYYEDLPKQLQAEGVTPNIPWLYDFKLDFRFK